MDDPLAVGITDGIADTDHQRQLRPLILWPDFQVLVQRQTIDQFHGKPEYPGRFTTVIDVCNVGMFQRSGQLNLAFKTLPTFFRGKLPEKQCFERHFAVGALLERAKDHRGGPFPQLTEDRKPRDDGEVICRG